MLTHSAISSFPSELIMPLYSATEICKLDLFVVLTLFTQSERNVSTNLAHLTQLSQFFDNRS